MSVEYQSTLIYENKTNERAQTERPKHLPRKHSEKFLICEYRTKVHDYFYHAIVFRVVIER